MLAQVGPVHDVAALTFLFESTRADGSDERCAATVLRNLFHYESIDVDEQWASAAIVLPRYWAVFDVINDSFCRRRAPPDTVAARVR
jgi:hypothetical protein